jgi:hypothetical protein
MSVNLSSIKQQNYIGTPYAIPMKLAPGLFCVPLKFNWQAYGASDTNQNIAVSINLTGTTNQPRQLLQQIKSVYIDNTGSAVPIYVQFTDTLFTAIAQPYSAGWYPVFTNGFEFVVAGLGFTSLQSPTTQIFVTNSPVAPYTDAALQTVLPQFLSSPSLGGGAGLSSVTPVIFGQDYNNGNITVTGGGGNGAQVHGIIDNFGRFVNVVVDNPGTGYTGIPIFTPSGGQNIPPVFNNGNYAPGTHTSYNNIEYIWNGTLTIQTGAANWNGGLTYNPGNQVNYLGTIYQCTQISSGPTPPSAPTRWQIVGPAIPDGSPWISSGTAPGTTATFTGTLSAVSNPIVSSGLSLAAIGDQFQNVQDTCAAGTFRNNLWGTPYGSGFIYLKSIDVSCPYLDPGVGVIQWELINSNGYAPLTFQVKNNSGQFIIAQHLLNLSDMNVKLDATLTWSLRGTLVQIATNTISHGWCWTYSQQ